MNSSIRDEGLSGLSLQNTLKFLVEALKIVREDSEKYYMKRASDVSQKTLLEVGKSFIVLSELTKKFAMSWIESRRSGPDAIEKSSQLSERIDVKLLEKGKLDFEQFKKIIVRLNRADDALRGLSRIGFYISYYRDLCAQKKLVRNKELAELFMNAVLNQAKDTVKSDSERLKMQIGRCNLYYQSKINQKMFRLSLVSLLISSFAFIFSLISFL